MQSITRIRTAPDFLSWAVERFEASVESQGCSVTAGARQALCDYYQVSGERLARRQGLFRRWQPHFERLMEEQGFLSARCAKWSRSEEVRAEHVEQAVAAHREIKAWTPLCPYEGQAETDVHVA